MISLVLSNDLESLIPSCHLGQVCIVWPWDEVVEPGLGHLAEGSGAPAADFHIWKSGLLFFMDLISQLCGLAFISSAL